MIRIALDLRVLDLPDSDAWADPCYLADPAPPHTLTAWYIPTPGLLCWVGKMLIRGKPSLSPADFSRMSKVYDDLSRTYPVAAVPVRPAWPTNADEFKALSNFLAGSDPVLYGPPVPTGEHEYVKGKRGKAKFVRPILAWRPRLPCSGSQVVGGARERTYDDDAEIAESAGAD